MFDLHLAQLQMAGLAALCVPGLALCAVGLWFAVVLILFFIVGVFQWCAKRISEGRQLARTLWHPRVSHDR